MITDTFKLKSIARDMIGDLGNDRDRIRQAKNLFTALDRIYSTVKDEDILNAIKEDQREFNDQFKKAISSYIAVINRIRESLQGFNPDPYSENIIQAINKKIDKFFETVTQIDINTDITYDDICLLYESLDYDSEAPYLQYVIKFFNQVYDVLLTYIECNGTM